MGEGKPWVTHSPVRTNITKLVDTAAEDRYPPFFIWHRLVNQSLFITLSSGSNQDPCRIMPRGQAVRQAER